MANRGPHVLKLLQACCDILAKYKEFSQNRLVGPPGPCVICSAQSLRTLTMALPQHFSLLITEVIRKMASHLSYTESSLGRLTFLSTTMYLHELSTTGAVPFSEFCIDLSSKKAYIFHLSYATQARANLRGILKGSNKTLVKVLVPVSWVLFSLTYIYKVVEKYLPHICAILNCVEPSV